MNTAIRAHRILAAMANYRMAAQTDAWLLKLSNGRLGEPIGYYRNPGLEAEMIGVFSDGLAWYENDRSVAFRFADVSEVVLPTGKESEGLLLKMQDGEQIHLPVRGQRGKFFDSMEMLRFLDRVIHDIQGKHR